MLRSNRILVVDDNPDNVQLLEMILEDVGYSEVTSTTDPFEAIELFKTTAPDIVLMDLHMPGLNGFALTGELRNQVGGGAVPIVVLTGDESRGSRERALRAGASDFLTKPFDKVEIVLRVRNLLELRRLHSVLEMRNRSLDAEVKVRTSELEEARRETLERLAIAAEFRDDQTGEHARRVGRFSSSIAKALGLAAERIEVIERAAPLHDLGKIGIPDHILLKPGPLTEEEFEVMKRHTTIGARVLAGSRSRVLRAAETIAATHHERWNGSGYIGLSGGDIPLLGRVVAVADAFDAITTDRPYRDRRSNEEAMEEICRSAGAHFDPGVVEAFMECRTALSPEPSEVSR
ncbi:MAG: cyclic di-GMP phosphodiesterase [Actinomycetota bacterium]|jgi:putative two-component system response regulator|nr:cyclic di-GMP phosphodiesterase [Actinomycetota bacterium]